MNQPPSRTVRRQDRLIPLTVALLTYNRAHYLREAIAGILAQTYQDFEFLILDNGSTDDTPAVVLGTKDRRIRYVRNPPGHEVLFNGISAIKIARGQRIIITHDDDVMQPTMLAKRMAIMDAHPDITAVWTNTSTIDRDGNTIDTYFTPPGPDRIYGRGEFIARFPTENLWPLPSTLMFLRSKYPRRLADRLYYQRDLAALLPPTHGGDDVLIPALMNTAGSVAFLNEPLLKYRRHGTQDSNRTHLSLGILNTYKILCRMAAKLPERERVAPVLQSHLARFTAQHEIIHTRTSRPNRARQAKLTKLFERACAHTDLHGTAAIPLLPIWIFLSQIGACSDAIFRALAAPTPEHPTAMHALFHWACLRHAGGNLFAHLPAEAHIVILGSALISALLIHEARAAGLNLLGCIDSNVTRQGKTMLDIPIHPPVWLSHQGKAVDYVILSSERDQDSYLHEFIRSLNPHVKTLSWKTLALEAHT